MAFLRMLSGSLEVAGNGIAVGALALADEVAGRRVPELRDERRNAERRLHSAAEGVGSNATVVGGDLGRILDTTRVSVGALARIITDPAQSRRLLQLIETYDLKGFVEALVQRRVQLRPDFFPSWVRRAGGYFPKFAQVLAVRADLIHDREVLEQFGRCLEDMPARPLEAVCEHLQREGWPQQVCAGVGAALNAGTVAQVNQLTLPDGTAAVVKVAWPDTYEQMRTDFRLFAHASDILAALRLDDQVALSVSAMFAAVGKNEPAVLREFDMRAEAQALRTAAELCRAGGDWDAAYAVWLTAAQTALAQLPPPLNILAATFALQAQAGGACRVRVPEPLEGLCCGSAMAMSRAGGESLHRLLGGEQGDAGRQEAGSVLLGSAMPFIGWLLLCKSSSHFAHVDPHPGNFRWDAGTKTLWLLDWGSNVTLSEERRRALCLLIILVNSGDRDGDEAVADAARAFGVRGDNSSQLACLIRGMLNATQHHSAQDALTAAAVDSILSDVDDRVVTVVRCLATLGGLLKELQRVIRDEHQQNMRLSLASIWQPFAEMGL